MLGLLAPQLKVAGYTLDQLQDVGYTLAQLKKAGFRQRAASVGNMPAATSERCKLGSGRPIPTDEKSEHVGRELQQHYNATEISVGTSVLERQIRKEQWPETGKGKAGKQLTRMRREEQQPGEEGASGGEQHTDGRNKEQKQNATIHEQGIYHAEGEDTMSRGTLKQATPAFQELYAHAELATSSATKSISSLAAFLTQNTMSDEESAWVIFAWLCCHVRYDVDGLHGRAPKKPTDAESVLKHRLCVCAGYSALYERLCQAAGLEVLTVGGHARTSENEIGAPLTSADGHAWNAVKIAGEWILVDSTWGAGTCTSTEFTREFRPHFFGVAPKVMAYSHLPEKPEWQLLSHPVSSKVFVSQPIVWTAPFFAHGMGFLPERPSGAILLKDSNQASLKLRVPVSVMLLTSIDNEECRCFQQRSGDVVTIHLRVPKGPSLRKLTVFAKQGRSASFTAVCKFAVTGSVGPGRFVEPWFPKVWQDGFSHSGIKFNETLPCGLLKVESGGRLVVHLQVPKTTGILANLVGSGEKVNAPHKRIRAITPEVDLIEISCDQVNTSIHSKLLVFANQKGARSFQAVVSYIIAD